MTVQAIRPAGAGHETAAVLAVCALIFLLAVTTVILRTTTVSTSEIAASQIDARHGLTAAEQGIYADLLVAADEIAFADTVPDVEALAGQMIPPFATDASTARRGNHDWLMKQESAAVAYIGTTQDPETAGSLLLLMTRPAASNTASDVHGHATEPVQVWLYQAGQKQPAVPSALDHDSLMRDGWKQIVSQFDAGATRH